MKIRQGFVSNSSSSSFAIDLQKLSKNQFLLIKYRNEELPEDYKWRIYIDEDKYELCGYTDMDSFNMYKFLVEIGIDSNDITMED